jgi:hypothetical protein
MKAIRFFQSHFGKCLVRGTGTVNELPGMTMKPEIWIYRHTACTVSLLPCSIEPNEFHEFRSSNKLTIHFETPCISLFHCNYLYPIHLTNAFENTEFSLIPKENATVSIGSVLK